MYLIHFHTDIYFFISLIPKGILPIQLLVIILKIKVEGIVPDFNCTILIPSFNHL